MFVQALVWGGGVGGAHTPLFLWLGVGCPHLLQSRRMLWQTSLDQHPEPSCSSIVGWGWKWGTAGTGRSLANYNCRQNRLQNSLYCLLLPLLPVLLHDAASWATCHKWWSTQGGWRQRHLFFQIIYKHLPPPHFKTCRCWAWKPFQHNCVYPTSI